MKGGKGDSGKAYHVRREMKEKKKRDKEISDIVEMAVTGRIPPQNRAQRREQKKREARK